MKIQSTQVSRPQAAGFTLVELLVTISIIAVLAGVAFVMASRVKSSASAAVDANDMRTISSAIQLYAADKNGLLPTTASGVSPTYAKNTATLLYWIAPYLGRDNPRVGEFFPELAAANWQKASHAATASSLLVHQTVFTGVGKFGGGNPMRPDPSMTTFGYPYAPQRAPQSVAAVMGTMSNPAACLMLSEVDKLHPEFKVSKPSWLADIPDGMAHVTYRLGLYWDGHVGRLDKDLNPM